MATKINKDQVITMQNGEDVTVKPLNIKGLRKFMEVVEKFSETEKQSEQFDIMVEATSIALEKVLPEHFEDKDYLEENLDLDAINTIMTVASGIDFSGGATTDPNLPTTG
jgi:hypothetical protein